MFGKNKKLKPFEKLQFDVKKIDSLNSEWCDEWLKYNRNIKRTLYPEWFCIIAPATKKYITDTLGYELPENYDATHSAVIFLSDKMMWHFYATNLVEYEQLDNEFASLFANDAMLRIQLLG